MREIKFSKTIIAWALYIGSIPIYDYSLGVRVHPPLYIFRSKKFHRAPNNNVVDWYIMAQNLWVMTIASPNGESK